VRAILMSMRSIPRPPGRNRLTHEDCYLPSAELIAGDPQEPRGGRIESRKSREYRRVVHGGEVQRLVRISPVDNEPRFEKNEGHLPGEQIGKCPVEDRGRCDLSLVKVLVEGAAQVEITILSGWEFGEIDREVGGDETRNAGERRH